MAGMPWGGSEELWYLAARELQRQGHEIAVNYQWWEETASQLLDLQEHGAEITFRNEPRKPTKWSWIDGLFQFSSRNDSKAADWLTNNIPDLLVVTAGFHPDAIPFTSLCQRREIPYVINVQCASHSVFLHERRLDTFRDAYSQAARAMFVSPENQHKLETNLAMELPNAEIICNPFNVNLDVEPTWPEGDTLRLACVGRIHFVSKGQDILVDVLRQDKWRQRDIKVSLYGKDQGNERQLRELIELHGLQDKIEFAGFSKNITELWKQNHGLILPSRYEGAALVVVEAMMCHRIAVTTDIGRNKELIDDNESGFIAKAPTAELVDEALERAWQKRESWREMGLLAGRLVRERFCNDPVGDFVNRLLQQAEAKTPDLAEATS